MLLFVDETECPETDVFSLVGLVVPIEQAEDLRLKFSARLRRPAPSAWPADAVS
jgi:hypothetical protein